MSQLFDSLRRARSRDREGRGLSPERAARAEAVLATLGYAREPRRRRPVLPALAAMAALVVTAAGAWYMWTRDGSPRTAPPGSARGELAATPRKLVSSPPAQATPGPSVESPRTPPPDASRAAPAPVPPPGARDAKPPRREPTAGAPGTTGSAAEIFRLALHHHRAGDLARAEAHYRTLLARNPGDARAHNNLGLLLRDRGLPDDAARELRRALLIDSRYANARNNLGVVLLGQSRLDEAAAEFERVLADEPGNADALVNLALVDKAEGRAGRARERLLDALLIDARHPPAHFNLAVLYEQSGDTSAAIRHYEAFLEHAGASHAGHAAAARTRIAALRAAGS